MTTNLTEESNAMSPTYTVQQTINAMAQVCAITGKPLGKVRWSIFRAKGEAICREAAAEVAPLELQRFVDELNRHRGPIKDLPTLGIAWIDGREMNNACPFHPTESFVPIQRRGRYEICAGMARGEEEKLISAAAAEEHGALLSEVMHRFHGTTPPPKPPTAEEIRRAGEREEEAMRGREAAELVERMNRKKKEAASLIAAALDDKNLTSSQKAERAIEALYEVFQRRP